MERPNYNFEPKTPSTKSPIPGKTGDTCGIDWHLNIEVRVPYKHIDNFVNVLPIIHQEYAAIDSDLSISLPILLGGEFQGKLQAAVTGAREILNTYTDGGYMDTKNRNAILVMVNRAQSYLSKAKALQKYWDEYSSDPGKGPGWPLSMATMGNGCEHEVAPKKGSIFTMSGGGPAVVEFVCPTQQSKSNHSVDRAMFYKLMRAALYNCRCAQEGAASVGTYNRNKEVFNSRASVGGVMQAPAAVKPKFGIMQATVGAGDEPDNEPAEEPEAPKKKKDNTLMLVGAAAIGLLMLKK